MGAIIDTLKNVMTNADVLQDVNFLSSFFFPFAKKKEK